MDNCQLSTGKSPLVPAGYKRTEVGVIPEDWEIGRLDDLNPFVTSGSRGWAKYYSDYGFAFIRMTNLSRESIYLDLDDLKVVDLPSTDREGSRTQLQDSDLLISITADVGIIGYVDSSVPKPAYINQHIALVRFDVDKADQKFLAYFLASTTAQQIFRSFTDQGAKTGMNLMGVRAIQVVLPPLPEQRAIADVLSDVDALIAALERLIAKNRAIKQGTMQQILTSQTRLPGFSEPWEVVSISELVSDRKELFDDGDWIESEFITDKGVRLVQTGNIGEGRFIDKESKKYISPDSFEKLKCKEVKPGDILICRLAEPAGRACILTDIGEEKIITAVDVSIFRPLDSLADRRYLVNVFCTSEWFSNVSEKCGGTTRSRIARSKLGKIKIKLPPLSEQRAIADVLSDMDAEIAALEARRDKTRAIKQGMMQELLTGRIRLV
jgi:type I restriction enzyme, S subunit